MKKKKCVFTNIRNERIMLPVWLSYYSKYFDPSDIYVINQASDDGTIEEARKKYQFVEELVPLNKEEAFPNTEAVTQLGKDYQKKYLGSYEYVLFAEADEFVVPHWNTGLNLSGFIDKFDKDFIHCTAYEIIQKTEEEGALDFSKPILRQRKYWYKNKDYNKPLLSRVALNWVPGFHFIHGQDPNLIATFGDPDLLLLHLKRVDHETAMGRNIERSSPEQRQSHFDMFNALLTEIPDEIKDVV